METQEQKTQPGPESRASVGAGERVLVQVPLVDLEPDPFQPRKEFNDASIRDLAASIEQHGLLQPLIVRPKQGPNSRGKYWIVAGERRYRAARLLGMEGLPCQIQPYANLTAAVTALVENVHREDLSEIDKAEALRRIKQATEKSWEEVAELVKLSHIYVKRLVGLLKLEEPVKEMVRRGDIPARTAIALKPLPPTRQIEMAERVVKEGLTAEEIREASGAPSRSRRRDKAVSGLEVDAALFPSLGPESEPNGRADERDSDRQGPVVQGLEEMIRQLERMGDWLADRDWSPSRLSPEKQELIHRLYHAASQFQQQTAYIRTPIKEAELSDAEKLKRMAFPF